MTITPSCDNNGITLQYSLDTINWVNISANGVTPSASVIYFRGSAMGTKSLFTGTSASNAWIFADVTNLEVNGDITMLIQDILGDNISDMQLGVNAFYSMFHNCISLVKAPALPATTLATNCYSNMFYGCTGLTTTPQLPATTLANYCYSNMFYGCTKIKLSTTKTGGYVNEYRVPTVGTGKDSANTKASMFSNTGGTFKGAPTINTTYYTENTIV